MWCFKYFEIITLYSRSVFGTNEKFIILNFLQNAGFDISAPHAIQYLAWLESSKSLKSSWFILEIAPVLLQKKPSQA